MSRDELLEVHRAITHESSKIYFVELTREEKKELKQRLDTAAKNAEGNEGEIASGSKRKVVEDLVSAFNKRPRTEAGPPPITTTPPTILKLQPPRLPLMRMYS